ncbi:MAG: DMT family transporter [Bryobacterales bacterium]|nr:DMT family transporter [Bryobacterales bacterium]
MKALTGPLLAILAATGFSAKAIFIKLAYAAGPVDAVTLLALRLLLSLPFFAAMVWWGGRGREPISKQDWAKLIGLGFLGNYAASIFDFYGLQYISAALERLILFTYPAIVVLFSAVFLGRAVHGREIVATLLSFSGIALVFWRDLRFTGDARALWTGSALVFGASLTYALFLLFNTPIIRRVGPMRFTGVVTMASAGFVFAHFLAVQPVSKLWVNPRVMWLAVGLALVSTTIPNWLTAEAIKRIGSSRFAIIGTIGPILTIFMGGFFLNEPLTLELLAGSALVLGGIALVSR